MKHHKGRIEVVCGSMFSGKSEELMRRLRRAEIAQQCVQVFKPEIDARYGMATINSHDGRSMEAVPVDASSSIEALMKPETTVIGIDEAQFFDEGLPGVCRRLASQGMRVIIAGLDLDFRGMPFGPMPQLMAEAEQVEKLQAICMVCGEPAYCTQRIIDGQPAHFNDPIIMIGARESYEARCRQHHQVPGRPD